jgi:hypothetical protein
MSRYMDNQIYWQEKDTVDSQRSINKLRVSHHNMINFRDCIFMVCPKLNYDFHREYKKSMEYFKKLLKTENMTEKQRLLKK